MGGLLKVVINATGGPINIGNVTNSALINMNGGLVFLNALGKPITIQGAQIQTFAPISYEEQEAEQDEDFIVDTDAELSYCH
jgi:hypothetical protein